MADEVRVWQVGKDNKLADVHPTKLDLENRIEKWIKQDISVLQPNLFVIGEQVRTAYGKYIDLLCIDSEGSLVIVELKRGMTPREVTAQALDYASWVKELGVEKISEIALAHLPSGETLESAFLAKFDTELPDTINSHHSMLVVASEIDDSTQRIIRYLSEAGIDINAVQFHMFHTDGGQEFLARTFTVDKEEAQLNVNRNPANKRTWASRSLDEILAACTNSTEKEFFKSAIEQGQRTNARGTWLAYPSSGTIRWYLRPRREYATVIQKGRFTDDEEQWTKGLANADLSERRKGNELKVRLRTKADFDFFSEFVHRDISSFNWLTKAASEEDDDEDTEGQ